MSELIAYGNEVDNVFQLIGFLENDITKSIAWALAKCPFFLKVVINSMLGIDVDPEKVRITYQQYEQETGITDLEVTDDDLFFVIVEAKRGWILPGAEQLTKYSKRHDISASKAKTKAIITMSECSENYAELNLPFKEVGVIPVKHLSWRRIYEVAKDSKKFSNNAEKNLLDELIQYLGGIMTTQKKDSNWVYVVSLGKGYIEDSKLTWIDVVNKKHKYFHPAGGNGWPKDPVNYVAFRYDGRLQSIHHVEGYTVTNDLSSVISDMPKVGWGSHYVYDLGPAIIPPKTVKTGNIYRAGRRWAMFDTLLTADTISEACEISKKRMGNEE